MGPVFGKSTLLGTQSFNSLAICGLWTNHSFNKDCLYSFPGPPGAHKEPTRGPTKKEFLYLFFSAAVGRKVGPLGELFGRLPGRLGALPRMFDQQIMPPEPPGTHGSPRGPQKKKKFFWPRRRLTCADLRRPYLAGRTSLGTCATCFYRF